MGNAFLSGYGPRIKLTGLPFLRRKGSCMIRLAVTLRYFAYEIDQGHYRAKGKHINSRYLYLNLFFLQQFAKVRT